MNTVVQKDVERLEQAADWLIRLKESPLEAAIAEWMDWCEADPRNLTAFEEIRGVWGAAPPAAARSVPARRLRTIWTLAAGIAAMSVFAGIWLYGRQSFAPARQHLSTPLAMHSESVLADGSRLALGGLSKVSTQFSSERRLIVVESGEAFFRVARDPHRPFTVQAGPLAVTALGTAFNVRRGPDRIVVTVTEGRVGVAAEHRQPVQVAAGEEISYSQVERRLAVLPANTESALAWQRGVFKYVREPLSDVVADLNRYASRRIVIEDEALKEERYTGTVFGNGIEDWLQAVESAFGASAVEEGNQVVLKRK